MAFGRVDAGSTRLVPNRDRRLLLGMRAIASSGADVPGIRREFPQLRGGVRASRVVGRVAKLLGDRRDEVGTIPILRALPRHGASRVWGAAVRIGLSVIVRHARVEKTEMRGTRVIRARGAMGRGGHSDDEGTPYDQRLEEVEFMRSACVAAQRGDVDKLRAMLHRRPDVMLDDGVGGDSGYTPLHYAAREGHAECVRALLASGANANARTRAGGATPLHRAAFTGSGACVMLLLEGGADPCLRDADGESALHKASANGHADVVRALLRAGGERGIAGERDRKGMTPVERAADEATRAAFGDRVGNC